LYSFAFKVAGSAGLVMRECGSSFLKILGGHDYDDEEKYVQYGKSTDIEV